MEIEAARRVAAALGVSRHVVVDIDLRVFGGSALTDDVAVPKDRPPEAIGADIPVTYVPARNTIFLSFALAWAEVLEAGDIFIGVNALDYSGYPDCRPEYVEAYERMANLATKAGVAGRTRLTIRTPLIQMTKAEIVRAGVALGGALRASRRRATTAGSRRATVRTLRRLRSPSPGVARRATRGPVLPYP